MEISDKALLSGYKLSRSWFDFCFDNPEKVSPNHSAIYFFAIEHCNRLGWKDKFGFPTQMTMDAIGIKKHQTYIRYFNDLVDWGFIKLIQKSQNQYSSNIISLQSALPKNGKALDKAIITHAAKQIASTGQSNSSIDKPITNKPDNQSNIDPFLDLTSELFGDQIWIEQVKITHKGKDLNQAWSECYLHHSNSISPPTEIWQWRQKLNTWLSIKPVEKKKSKFHDKPKI